MVPVSCLMMLCLTQVTAKAGTTDPTAYDNVVYVEPATVSASSSTEVELDICMNNTAEIRGFQFDLYLPDGMTVVKTSKGKIAASLNEARLPEDDEHKLTVAEQADGAIRFLCASQYDETFTGATGKIITLKVNIGGLAAGEHPMTLKAIKLSESDISKFYEVDEIVTTFTVGSGSTGTDTGNNAIYVAPATVNPADGTEVILSVCMDNTAEIRGFQFDLYLPEGMTAVKTSKGKIAASLNADRLPEDDEHTLTVAEQADGAIRFLCGSQYDETFTGASGEIATIKVNIENLPEGDYPIVLKAIKLTESDVSQYYNVPEIVTTLTVSSDGDQAMAELETTMDNALELYNRIKYRYPGAAADLYNAINSVIDVPGNPSATKTEIEAAITALNDALIQAKNSIITGVDSVKSAADSNGDFIDLSGRQLKGKPSRAGVYFKNGNKFVVK